MRYDVWSSYVSALGVWTWSAELSSYVRCIWCRFFFYANNLFLW